MAGDARESLQYLRLGLNALLSSSMRRRNG